MTTPVKGGGLAVEPARVLRDIAALAERTGDTRGAQRVAWTDTWLDARRWLIEQLGSLPAAIEQDEAGNLWAELTGESGAPIIAIGSHLDSVPDGGRLDGSLGVLAALELLRGAASCGWDRATLRLVDWADEEGARFGHSLFGSSAATGIVSVERTQDLVDSDGLALPAVLERCGVVLERIGRSASRLLDLDALLELHIEQGPVLESAGTALGIPTGAVAISRHRLTFIGRGGHAGTTPMDVRRDAGGAAARAALAAREAAVRHEGLATIGEFLLTPGVATAIPSTARISVDLRHKNDLGVNHLREDIIAQSRLIAVQESCRLDIDNVWSFPAVQFDEHVVAAVSAVVPNAGALVSGALHDAVAVARWGLPTAMLLVRSVGGISHSPEEHTSDSDVVVAVRAYASAIGELAERLSNSEGRARGVGP